LFDRPNIDDRAILVDAEVTPEDPRIEELRELAVSAGVTPVAVLTGRRNSPDPRFYIGKGKLEELSALIEQNEAGLVLFNQALTPSQERNLEKALNIRVLDRTELILDIFAQRAQTHEGKLQVELAQLRHLSTRLVRGWTHLERQKGGIGLRGPGETQLETDKRLIGQRIIQIQKRLEKVEKQRNQGRRARKRAEIPVIGLVGYTNAGKSTLLNALTGAKVYAADQLFATLDPSLKRLNFGGGVEAILVDTVGFVRDLPHELIAAFRSTLQETIDADLLLHVIDASDEQLDETIAEVEKVIEEIGADGIPRIRVFNKIDRLEEARPRVERSEQGLTRDVWISAAQGLGLNHLVEALRHDLLGSMGRVQVELGPEQGKLRAEAYRRARVLSEAPHVSGGWTLELEGSSEVLALFKVKAGQITPEKS
jgi:GTP-binding protein HflX